MIIKLLKMKNSIIFFVIFFIFNSGYSKEFPGNYVTNNYDTIKCRIKVSVNPFSENQIDPLSCRYRVSIIDSDGLAIELNPDQIKGFKIENTSLGEMIFESLTVQDYGTFFAQRLCNGEIFFFKYFYPHPYDGSVQYHYLLKKNNEYRFIFPIGYKKLLSEYISDKVIVHQEFQNGNYKYKDLPKIIDLYNKSKN
jgi:hypothetical protein